MSGIYQPFQPSLSPQGLAKQGFRLKMASPSYPLSQVVYRYLQISVTQASPYPVMPDGTQALYFSKTGVLVGGAFDHAQNMQLLEPGDYFGVWFYPAALRSFFCLDLAEIQNQLVDTAFISSQQFHGLQEEIYLQDDFSNRVSVCETWLLKRFIPVSPNKLDHALSLILQSKGTSRIQQVSDQIGWSSRHLNRQFLQHTGLSTKSFSQVIRLQAAWRDLANVSQSPLDTALDLGYFDQAHFIKSVKKHLGKMQSSFDFS